MEGRRSEVKRSRTDTGLAPDCIYSSTKRFTFTKSFQLHGARRISTLLSSFRDVILLLAIVRRCKQGRRLLSLSHSVPSPRNDFKVVAENRSQILGGGASSRFRTAVLRSHFVLLPLDFVSFYLSLSIMGFRCSLAKYENFVGFLNS